MSGSDLGLASSESGSIYKSFGCDQNNAVFSHLLHTLAAVSPQSPHLPRLGECLPRRFLAQVRSPIRVANNIQHQNSYLPVLRLHNIKCSIAGLLRPVMQGKTTLGLSLSQTEASASQFTFGLNEPQGLLEEGGGAIDVLKGEGKRAAEQP